MNKERKPSPLSRRFHAAARRGSGILALAMLFPSDSFAMDSTPRQTFDQTGHTLSLLSVRYLDSMRWMEWKPGAQVLKVDTLLLPDRLQPGTLRLPSEYERDLPSTS